MNSDTPLCGVIVVSYILLFAGRTETVYVAAEVGCHQYIARGGYGAEHGRSGLVAPAYATVTAFKPVEGAIGGCHVDIFGCGHGACLYLGRYGSGVRAGIDTVSYTI
mgnify:CR=1 FL=1